MSSKLMIAVKSCQNDLARGDHDIIRQTWGRDAKNAGATVKFFVGQRQVDSSIQGRRAVKYESDEVLLSCKDDYNSLPFKTREICSRMTGKAIDGLFICDTDTFIDVLKLMASGMERFDYAGYFRESTKGTFRYDAIDRDGNHEVHDKAYNWASGGYGYYLSMTAAEEVADAYPSSWAEDLWVGQVIGAGVADGRLKVLNFRDQRATEHFPSAQFHTNYDVESGHFWMQGMYRAHQ